MKTFNKFSLNGIQSNVKINKNDAYLKDILIVI